VSWESYLWTVDFSILGVRCRQSLGGRGSKRERGVRCAAKEDVLQNDGAIWGSRVDIY